MIVWYPPQARRMFLRFLGHLLGGALVLDFAATYMAYGTAPSWMLWAAASVGGVLFATRGAAADE